ncbi:coagulation factor 5/8 type domain protein [Niastella koreensis GR20-10]|uniref:alpha-L-fucosidase n=1 Tax=Niastella koreensis (strain DSM 17620 / KACC 11465 / NBRC 106392 / GR20-10) TaxID=700598 RepID=G8TJ74_NIAKG|nr:alpha-L-fucosidase [Niastella koreensis]AEV98607.1 coagulation factor 5/8 type domain protein [Niastella koreensis GR20-10]
MKISFLIKSLLLPALVAVAAVSLAQVKSQELNELQQRFVDLKFGMFIHFNIPTYFNQDWPDPEGSSSAFNPTKLNADQWAKAAKSANMTYGCLTTKHHSGFCIWDTRTTDYNVMHSPYKKDVVREFVRAFRANGLKVMLYYSILDTHHKLRPNEIQQKHIEMVKKQLTELLTNYGQIEALIIDGWDAPWSRISYDDIPFEQIYKLVKKLQPNCILMDLNGAKYPKDGLYYTDIKTYEMGAGQRMSKEINQMPSLACLPLQSSWFWKNDFPETAVKDPAKLVSETLVPLNNANCNFILNVAPNRDGQFDDNAVAALKQIGQFWHNDGSKADFKPTGEPIRATNLAKHQPANSSWSNDMNIMDFANDDDFGSSWQSNPEVKNPWYEIDFRAPQTFNEIVIFEQKANIKKYKLEYFANNKWNPLFDGEKLERVKLHRFAAVKGERVRMQIESYDTPPSIAEFGVYNEPR